jgi:site-specific DNA-methyltransferase (adenine-specific)
MYKLMLGDCIDSMGQLEENSIDSIVTDPPYHLKSIVKRFGKEGSAPAQFGTDGAYSRHSTGFMGKEWDGGEIAQDPRTWEAALRVAKPGAYLLAFGGTRTFHRMMCAIEDAGWEIRDTIMWVYGSGFPKSHNVGLAMDKKAGAERKVIGSRHRNVKPFDDENGWNDNNTTGDFDYTAPATEYAKKWEGWGTALKPAWEPIVVARKPLIGSVIDNVLEYSTGAINIDASRIPGEPVPINKLEEWSGFGQKEKPKYEQEINNKGRWPANIIHDGSEEVLELFPAPAGAFAPVKRGMSGKSNGIYGDFEQKGDDGATFRGDSGSAARFFYCAKASRGERDAGLEDMEEKLFSKSGGGQAALARGETEYQEGENISVGLNTVKRVKNNHPTVKPLALMRYLITLVTPPNGTVLDCFLGSGSTGVAAVELGFDFIGMEKDEGYLKIADARIKHAELPMFRVDS